MDLSSAIVSSARANWMLLPPKIRTMQPHKINSNIFDIFSWLFSNRLRRSGSILLHGWYLIRTGLVAAAELPRIEIQIPIWSNSLYFIFRFFSLLLRVVEINYCLFPSSNFKWHKMLHTDIDTINLRESFLSSLLFQLLLSFRCVFSLLLFLNFLFISLFILILCVFNGSMVRTIYTDPQTKLESEMRTRVKKSGRGISSRCTNTFKC